MNVIVDTYHLLGEAVPDTSEVVSMYNASQRADGTWPGMGEDDIHYSVFTLLYTMMYERFGISTPNTLEAFFNSIDTWDEYFANITSHESENNYWGGVVGYVELYKAVRDMEPPWFDILYASAEANYDNWIEKNHQRGRVVQMFNCLEKDVPLQSELLASVISHQNGDGGWGNEQVLTTSYTDDTTLALQLLARNYN